MGSPATRAASADNGHLELTYELLDRVDCFYRVPLTALRSELTAQVEEGAARGIIWAADLRSRWLTRKGDRRSSAAGTAVSQLFEQFAPERLNRIRSEHTAALWFAVWLTVCVSDLRDRGRPLSDLDFLSDAEVRDTLDLAVGGGSYFDAFPTPAAHRKRFVIDGVLVAGSPLRAVLRRRCAALLADNEWCTEALNRTLGHPSVIDVIGGVAASKTVQWCHSLLVDMPAEAPAELSSSLFNQLSSSQRHALQVLFADSPLPASALWWPNHLPELHAAATAWLDANPPQPVLFEGAGESGEQADPLRAWFTALGALTRPEAKYSQRNRADAARNGPQLNADVIAATFAELASRCRLVCSYVGQFEGRKSVGGAPRFAMSPTATVATLSGRLGRELRHSDLVALPAWVSQSAAPAMPDPTATATVRIGIGSGTSRPELNLFALRYARAHDNYLPCKSQIRNLAEVEELLGCTWWEYCEELIASYPQLRRTLSSYARDGIALASECFGAPVSVETAVSDFVPSAEGASRCKVDATLWRDDSSVLWFEFDGEGHFVEVLNWDLEAARAGDCRRHRQLRAAHAAGVDVTLVAFHHAVLPGSKGPLTAEILSEVIDWAEHEGFKCLFLRPVGSEELRASESRLDELVVVRFGDVEVVASELVRPVRD